MTIFKRHFQILFPLVNILVFSELLPFLEAVSNPPKDELKWLFILLDNKEIAPEKVRSVVEVGHPGGLLHHLREQLPDSR